MRKYLIAALLALTVAGGLVAYNTSSQQPAELHACSGNDC
jgi:hypothetical protein